MKHVNVALFVPDEGCPNRCSFCNQKTISGKTKKLTAQDVSAAVKRALASDADCNKGEIAFFGGSFTAIDTDYMIRLLAAAKAYIDDGSFAGIRISTRPDCIDEEILDLLKYYGVTAIELGCQSMSDQVLALNRRGHTSEDIVRSAQRIKDRGFELGVQMMTGLYGDDDESALETAQRLISLAPDTARIYPTVVLEGTELCELYRRGVYSPQTLEEAVSLCARLLLMFHRSAIPVIRLGLHSGGNVQEGYVAGAYHPAFRELCEGKIYGDLISEELKRLSVSRGTVTVAVGSRYISMAVGQKKSNLLRLEKEGYSCKIIQDENLKKYEIEVRG